jgi:hypothetical protein
MDESDLVKTLEAMANRGDPAYRTQSGAFLGVLHDLAKQQKIEAFAEAVQLHDRIFRAAAAFIRGQVPHIIVEQYFSRREDLDYEKFIRWSLKNDAHLIGQLKSNCANPKGLLRTVNAIVNEVDAWEE